MPAEAGGLRIAVLGYIIRGPIGGMAWHHLQYVLGLHRLGHDVLFVEDSDDYPSCYDPQRQVVDQRPDYGLAFAARAFGHLGIGGKWAYHDAHTGEWHGPRAGEARAFCCGADMLLNLSGVNPLRQWAAEIPVRALVDTDPAFTQIRHLQDPAARGAAAVHNVFFSFGENIGQPGCKIPDDGFPWLPTRQPLVPEIWSVTPVPAVGSWTTVMQWESYASREYGGVSFGMKSQSFSQIEALPLHVDQSLEMALGGESAPREQLRRNGWSLRNPLVVALSPQDYQSYIRASKGEFGVAKQGYVISRSGWFSERSLAYMASGRPVVVQDTGFEGGLAAEGGVLSFRDIEEAQEALEEAARDCQRHGTRARAVACEYFDYRKVLPSLVERALNA